MRQPEFEYNGGRKRSDNDCCIVSCAIGPAYQERLHSTRLHCEVNVPEAWRLFYRELPLGCPPHEESMYAFKIYAMQRAIDAGFRYILWMDSSFQPIASIEPLWERIRQYGWYAAKQGNSMVGEWSNDETLAHFGVSRDVAMEIRLCYSGLVGLDMQDVTAASIWYEWRGTMQNGLWTAPHFNEPGKPQTDRGEKFAGHVSNDPRVSGHRHDETSLSLILHGMGLTPSTLGFLTLEDPNGFIGHHVKLVVPGAKCR